MTPLHPPRAVIFDFGGVLCSFDIDIFLHRLESHTPFSFGELRALLPDALLIGREYETGLISSRQFHQRVCALTRVSMPEEEFARAYCDIFSPIESTYTLVRALHGRYRLGLLSNTSEWHFERGIRPVPVFPLFETVTLSFEVRSMKPDRPIYDDALRKLGLPASACAYVDDLPENIAAAAALGMRAVLFTTPGDVVAGLRQAGVDLPPTL
jgi:FMN phosphatase YigB (HAD superfamily)